MTLVFLCPTLGTGQRAPGTNLVVHIAVTSVTSHFDTTRITYVLTNDLRSRERLATFMVDAPSPVTAIVTPSPDTNWFTSRQFGSESVASWSPLGLAVRPGEMSPPLTFSAIGLPTIVRSRVEGWTPVDTVIPSDTLPLREIVFVTDSTVGVDHEPVFLAGPALLARLRSFIDRTCGTALKWITRPAVCITLQTSLDSAGQRLATADTVGTRSHMRRFLGELTAQRQAGAVTDNAYWLLKPNAEFLIKRHLLPRGRLMPRDDDPES